jgi:hypothetical protein
MYTILVNNSNELIVTVKERIMQRSKLMDNLHFLVEPKYKEHDMSGFTVMMEYILPISREYKTEFLTKSDALYKDMLEYKLPFDTCLTKEHGKIELQLTFTKVELDPEGQAKQYVRKTSPCTITIVPIAAWSDVVADSALSAFDQRLIQMDAMVGALSDMGQYMYENKADNIIYNAEDQYIQLTANGEPIGDRISWVNGGGCSINNVIVDTNGDLIVTLSDERVINAGHVVGANGEPGAPGVTFTPSVSNNYILSWTNDGGLENPKPIDLYPHDEWSNIDGDGMTKYVWEPI